MARIEPLGVAELKVVRHRLVRYTAGEIAHVENVLSGETRSRVHRRLRRSEMESEREVERSEESVRDLQSTERLEVEKEASETARSESRFNVGLSVTGSYGPVSATLNSDYSMSDAEEASQRESEKYGREVVERTVARISERVRTLRRERSLEESEETNTHSFEGGDQNVTGVYRWLDKTYRAKVITYGKRLMYQFVVPEPAAIYIRRAMLGAAEASLALAPVAPTAPDGDPLQPAHITRENYKLLVALSNVTEVTPPPPRWLALSTKIVAESPDSGHWTATESFEVPQGYEARRWAPGRAATWREGGDDDLFLSVGVADTRALMRDNNWDDFDGDVLSLQRSGEAETYYSGSVPVVATGFGVRTAVVTINVLCRITDERFAQWQLEVWRAIVEGYRREQAAYEERLAAAKVVGETPFGNQNPAINRSIEQAALRHGCLALWSDDALDPGPDPIVEPTDEDGYPSIDREAAIERGEVIAFLEYAFDWANMSYELLPYYWGRTSRWASQVGGSNTDPLFDAFLSAGAARVQVPVRRGEEGRLLYHRCTDIIWPDADIPSLTTTGDSQAEMGAAFLGRRSRGLLRDPREAVVGVEGQMVPLGLLLPMEVHVAVEVA